MRGDGTLENIRICNVRSLKDTGTIHLPSITLLVGENSSGKSTFLRTFPLIRQSISKRTDGPLLWAGDVDDYVDFGSFRETVTDGGPDKITFEFGFPFSFDLSHETFWPGNEYLYYSSPFETKGKNAFHFDVLYRITIIQNDNHEYISEFCVHLNKITSINFSFDSPQSEAKITVDGTPISIPLPQDDLIHRYYGTVSPLSSIFGFRLPNLSLLQQQLAKIFDSSADDAVTFANNYFFSPIQSQEAQTLIWYAGALLSMDDSLQKIDMQVQKKLLRKKREQSIDYSENISETALKRLKSMSSHQLTTCKPKLKLLFFYRCFSQIDKFIDSYFRQVHYITPLRATAERYYRLRNLAIDEVDYQGKNLAIFLNGLSPVQLKSFQRWTQQHFGFQVLIRHSGGHLSVEVSVDGGHGSTNLSDTGFGYSQILPIITQLWHLSSKKPKPAEENVPLVVAIEQPELHLHPAMQAKLAKAFIASIRLAAKNGYKLQLLLETHSQTIVNYFGQAIAHDLLKKDEISVVLFEKPFGTHETTVKISQYDSSGYLQNWPFGFFTPDEE